MRVSHRRRSSVNFGENILARKYVRKINKMFEFCMIFALKLTKCPNVLRYLHKKYFPRFFGGGGKCLLPLSPTPVLYYASEMSADFAATQSYLMSRCVFV